MYWILMIGGGLLGLVVLLAVIAWVGGSRLPEEHTASVAMRLDKSPDAVWAVIRDCVGHTEWAPGVTGVERLPDSNGREQWRIRMGRNAFVGETTVSEPPRLFVRTITDENGPFTGSWTYELTPDGEGVSVRLTEKGRIASAIPRFVMGYLVGEETFIKKHLAGLAERFGEEARWR